MLRITPRTSGGTYSLRLEGSITGAWVDELDRTWRTATAQADARRICVDLGEVYLVDDAGRDLLTQMYHAGVEFTTKGCVMPELVREIAGPADLLRRR